MLSLGSVSRARGGGLGCDWVEPKLKLMRCGGAAGPGSGLRVGKMRWENNPSGWPGLVGRGCHREGVVKRGERGRISRSLGGGDRPHPSQNSGQFRASP